jgi:small conductance mechanosensitive channel
VIPELPMDALLITYVVDAAYAILLLAGGWILTAWAARWVHRWLDNSRHVDPTLRPIIVNFVRYLVFGIVAVAALAKFGIQTASVLAVIGATGLAIALALQGTLSNVASGLMLLVLRPFSVGDTVDCEGISGKVLEVGLFATEFETADGLFVMVPNNQLFGKPMKNYSRLPFRRIEVKVGIPYTQDIGKALDTGLDVLKTDMRVYHGNPPQAVVSKLGPASIELSLFCWTARADFWNLYYDLNRAVKDRFDAVGIAIAYQPLDPSVGTKKL